MALVGKKVFQLYCPMQQVLRLLPALLAALLWMCGSGTVLEESTSSSGPGSRNGLGSNEIRGIFVDGDHVYAATARGLSVSWDRGERFFNRSIEDGLPTEILQCVHAAGDLVLIGTWGKGLVLSRDAGDTIDSAVSTEQGLPSNYIYDITVKSGTWYIATSEGLAVSTDKGSSFSVQTTADGLGSNTVRSVLLFQDKTIAATPEGVSVSGSSSYTNRTTDDGLAQNGSFDLAVHNNRLLVATQGGLAWSDDLGVSYSSNTQNENLPSNYLFALNIWKDRLWLAAGGLSKAGLYSTDINVSSSSQFTSHRKKTESGLTSDLILSLHSDGDLLAVGTAEGLGISRDGQCFEMHYSEAQYTENAVEELPEFVSCD
jgi:hypothetical protein